MRIYIDTDTGGIVRSPGGAALTTARSKRGDTTRLECVFLTDGIAQELADGTTFKFGAKVKGGFVGNFLVFTDSVTKTGTGESTVYTFLPFWSTIPLNNSLGALAELAVLAEVEWDLAGDGEIRSSDTLTWTVVNDVNRGGEALPEEPGPTYYTAAEVDALLALIDGGTP